MRRPARGPLRFQASWLAVLIVPCLALAGCGDRADGSFDLDAKLARQFELYDLAQDAIVQRVAVEGGAVARDEWESWLTPAAEDRLDDADLAALRARQAGVIAALPGLPSDPVADGSDASDDLWGLVLEAARLDDVVDQAVRTLELSVLAKYAFALAQQFNGFYHAYPVLKEERADVRLWRAAAIEYYRRQLTTALELMGCTVPERM